MHIQSQGNPDRLIVFGRYPVPGEVKTRLIPALGPGGAAELHRRLSEKTLVMGYDYGRQAGAQVHFCYAGGDPARINRWLPLPGLSHSPQVAGDMGGRMAAAFEEAFRSGCERAVLVGTDLPNLSEAHLAAAFTALESHDVVLGPSSDGGYWVLGLKKKPDLFRGRTWGHSGVLEQTLRKVRRLGLRYARLAVLSDLDTPADLEAHLPRSQWPLPYLSVVVPTLNEAPNLEATLAPLGGPDVEVLVADGGSRDATQAVAVELGAHLLSSPPGRAVQQNCAARQSRGTVLLFLHADTHLPEDYLNHIFETLMDPHVALGAFRFATDYAGLGMGLITWATRLRSSYFKLPYGDQGLFMRPDTYAQLGGFPEVAIAEDLLLVRQAGRLGKIEIAPAMAVTSGRRWRRRGVWRTTLINYLIAGGCLAGVPPKYLAFLYGSRSRPPATSALPEEGS